MTPLDRITAFVEGQTSLSAFMHALEQDEALQAVLEEDIVLRPYTNDGNLLLYVLQQNPSALTAEINVRDALSRYLSAKGRVHAAAKDIAQLYDIVLGETPGWLDPPDFFLRRIADKAVDLPGRKAVANMVKDEIAASFRYLKKPPRWLQSPTWIVVGERPLMFVGQMNLGRLKHDAAQVYLFFDEAGGEIRTVVQVA